jgi:hypothetical protein
MVKRAHHEEVGVSADGHASAFPTGVAAAAPPAGALVTDFMGTTYIQSDYPYRSIVNVMITYSKLPEAIREVEPHEKNPSLSSSSVSSTPGSG